MARPMTKEQIISNVYYDLQNGFVSIQDTLKQAKTKDPTITRVDVSNVMKKQPNKADKELTGVLIPTPHRSRGSSTKST